MQVKIDHVSYTYQKDSVFASGALNDVSFLLEGHFFASLIGKTGSGKSTLVEHINGLLLPNKGEVSVDNFTIYTKGKKSYFIDTNKKQKAHFNKRKQFDIKALRKKVGLVFQFPEYQLFESSVIKDVMYGPLNFKFTPQEALNNAKKALKEVGLDETYYERSPFELSGGEKRRVAIAGILALEPDLLILDEPTAGLDPLGERQMLELFNNLYLKGKNIILVTHNMEIVLKYVKKAIVMDNSKNLAILNPLELFTNKKLLEISAIEVPMVFKLAMSLINKGFDIDLKKIKDIPSLCLEIKRVINNG